MFVAFSGFLFRRFWVLFVLQQFISTVAISGDITIKTPLLAITGAPYEGLLSVSRPPVFVQSARSFNGDLKKVHPRHGIKINLLGVSGVDRVLKFDLHDGTRYFDLRNITVNENFQRGKKQYIIFRRDSYSPQKTGMVGYYNLYKMGSDGNLERFWAYNGKIKNSIKVKSPSEIYLVFVVDESVYLTHYDYASTLTRHLPPASHRGYTGSIKLSVE